MQDLVFSFNFIWFNEGFFEHRKHLQCDTFWQIIVYYSNAHPNASQGFCQLKLLSWNGHPKCNRFVMVIAQTE